MRLARSRPWRIRPWRGPGRGGRRRAAAAGVALAALLGAGAASWAAAGDTPTGVHRTNAFMTMPETPGSERTVRIDTSFFTPAGGGRHPAILLAHGFGGSKDDMTGEATTLARDGFAVLTWSARGFGRSTGAIGLDEPDREVADVEHLVDWLGHRKDVVQDGPDDPRVGVTGASYGGAVALLAAGYDKRIDAIAPQITWWDLPQALFPQNAQGEPADSGVFKKLWAGIFFTTGSTGTPSGSSPGLPGTGGAGGAPGAGAGGGSGDGSGGSAAGGGRGAGAGAGARSGGADSGPEADGSGGDGCRFTAQLCAVYRRAAVTGEADPAAIALLERSSPSSVGSRIKVPTLITQGENDSLFPLSQADEMARTIARNGAPVAVDWSSGGHDGGDQETARVDGRVATWFDKYLKHENVNTGPVFRVTRSGGIDTTTGDAVQRGASDDRYPGLGGTSQVTVRLSGGTRTVRNPAGGSPPAVSGVPGLGALSQLSSLGQSLAVDFPGQFAAFSSAPLTRPVSVTGSPSVRVTVSSNAPDGDAVLFAKLYDVGPGGARTLPEQLVAPLRVTDAGGAGRTVTVTLPAVDHEFAAGHRMQLVLAATDLAYASPTAPADYRVALAGRALTAPTVPALRTAAPGTAAWVWILPAAALALAAALLLTGRRPAAAARQDGAGAGTAGGAAARSAAARAPERHSLAERGTAARGPATPGATAGGAAAQDPDMHGPAAQNATTQDAATREKTAQSSADQATETHSPAAQSATARGPATEDGTTHGPAKQGSTAQGAGAPERTAQAPAAQAPETRSPSAQSATEQGSAACGPATGDATTQDAAAQGSAARGSATQDAATQGATAGGPATEDAAARAPQTHNPAAQSPTATGAASPAGRGGADLAGGEAVPLEIRGLSKRYRGSNDRYAVRELSFRVERGQVLGLLGPNGAGKTTTMRMLMGLITPDAGEIRVFGRPVSAGAPVLSRVGSFVEGAGFLPHLTGRANLDLYWRATGRPAADAGTEQALEIADLGEALDRAVRTYSQGMRQRLAIAQAMLGLPDLLILDEPTNGLDPPQIREMRSVVSRYAATGRTVIVSSHLLSEVEQSCTHLVVMDKGRLVAAGPVSEIVGESDALFVGAPRAGAEQLARAAVAVSALAGVAGAEAAEGGLVVRLGGIDVPGLLAELLRLGLPVERVGPHRRLEDAFLTLIGGQA